MRAVRFHGRGDIRLDEVEEPVCGSGQVKVCRLLGWKTDIRRFVFMYSLLSFKINPAFVGICGSGMFYLSVCLTLVTILISVRSP